MSKPLSIATILEANKVSSDVAFIPLIDLEVVDPITGVVAMVLHIARNPEPIVFNGNTYEPGIFDISLKEEAGSAAQVSLTVNDYLQVIQQFMEQYGGGIGSNVTFYLVNTANLAQGAEVQEYFQIVGASSSEYQHSFTLGAENALMVTFPRRRQTRDFCQWRYKSPECGYTGGLATCDLTLKGANGCTAHNNSLNFGGFPGINSNGYRYR